jgi:hypothetical protein
MKIVVISWFRPAQPPNVTFWFVSAFGGHRQLFIYASVLICGFTVFRSNQIFENQIGITLTSPFVLDLC